MKTMNPDLAVATLKWHKLNSAYALIAQLANELPPQVSGQLERWMHAMDALKDAADAHDAVLGPAESDIMGGWLNDICSGALDDSRAALPH